MRAAGTAAALVLLAASNAHASRLRLLVPSVTSFASDGSSYVAWQTTRSGPLTVLNTATSRRRILHVLAGCQLVDGINEGFSNVAADGRFLLDCRPTETGPEQEDVRVLTARTGTSVALPRDPAEPGGSIAWSLLGTRYARGASESEHDFVMNLATGEEKEVDEREYRNLSQPGAPGTRSVCPSLRTRVKRRFPPDQGGDAFEGSLFAEPFEEHGAVRLLRCNGETRTLPATVHPAAHLLGAANFLDLRDRWITWDDTRAEEPKRARLEAYNLRSGQRIEWRLPHLPVPTSEITPLPEEFAAGWSTHTAAMVFWLPPTNLETHCEDCSVETSDVYAAQL
jgi:hypothetical protein